MKLRAIDVKVGDRVVYLGGGTSRPSTGETLSRGDVGTVTQVQAVAPPHPGLVIDQETGETDPGRDGHAVVKWPHIGGIGVIWPDGEDEQWKRV